jgi:hypothetical protein
LVKDADISLYSSSIIKHLKDSYESDPRTALAFFYFSFNDAAKQSTDEMLSSLIKQLCCRRPITPQTIKDLGRYKELGQRPDTKTLEDMLLATVHGFSGVYLIIDALDECPFESGEQKKLLQSLCRIYRASSENLHILWTSRRESDIEAAISPLLSAPSQFGMDLSVYREAVDHDIGLHIDKTLDFPDYTSWPLAIKAEARAKLIEKADGM